MYAGGSDANLVSVVIWRPCQFSRVVGPADSSQSIGSSESMKFKDLGNIYKVLSVSRAFLRQCVVRPFSRPGAVVTRYSSFQEKKEKNRFRDARTRYDPYCAEDTEEAAN